MKNLLDLRKQGYRVTSQRKNILEALSSYPFTAEEIFNRLQKKRLKVDLASIYRTLEFFSQMGLVEEIYLKDGKKRYEYANKKTHHHHMVCKNCGDIENIALINEKKMIKEVVQKANFLIDTHTLEFFGLCLDCQ